MEVDMHFTATVAVTTSSEPAEVPVDGQTNGVIDAKIIRAEGDALFGQKALGYASIWSCPVANVSFDHTIHPFERHHAVQEPRPELDDIIHNMDKEMHHDVEECGREIYLEIA